MASFSKLFGRFVVTFLAGLIPASRPFCGAKKAALPRAHYSTGSKGVEGLELEPGGPRGYVVTLRDDSGALVFDAVACRVGRDLFLDLEPRGFRPENHGLAAGATHFAARIERDDEARRLTLSAARRDWIEDHVPPLGTAAPGFRRALARAVAEDAFATRVTLEEDGASAPLSGTSPAP